MSKLGRQGSFVSSPMANAPAMAMPTVPPTTTVTMAMTVTMATMPTTVTHFRSEALFSTKSQPVENAGCGRGLSTGDGQSASKNCDS